MKSAYLSVKNWISFNIQMGFSLLKQYKTPYNVKNIFKWLSNIKLTISLKKHISAFFINFYYSKTVFWILIKNI